DRSRARCGAAPGALRWRLPYLRRRRLARQRCRPPAPQRRAGGAARLVIEALEALRRRIDDRVAAMLHFEHGEAALHQAVGAEAEDAIEPREAVGIGDRGVGEIGALRRLRQHRGERHRVIAERREAWRRATIELREALHESGAQLRGGRGIPAAIERWLGAEIGIVPKAGAEELHLV